MISLKIPNKKKKTNAPKLMWLIHSLCAMIVHKVKVWFIDDQEYISILCRYFLLLKMNILPRSFKKIRTLLFCKISFIFLTVQYQIPLGIGFQADNTTHTCIFQQFEELCQPRHTCQIRHICISLARLDSCPWIGLQVAMTNAECMSRIESECVCVSVSGWVIHDINYVLIR